MFNEYSESESIDNTPKIRVVIRKRPIGKKELVRSDIDIIDIRGPQTVVVREMKAKVDLTKYIEEHNFNFDGTYDQEITNEALYHHSVRPLVDAAFNGAKVTCFAYGQTGSGKTYTMMGDSANLESKNSNDPVPGLYLLASKDIFETLGKSKFKGFHIWISFYEIYCGKLYDLLNGRTLLHAREDSKQNVNIVGLQEKRVSHVGELMEIIEFGNSNRVTGVTGANVDSSRSHAILQINIRSKDRVHGKMSFIDLAGSERGADVVDQNKQTRFDGAEINKSLLALKECIRALDQDKKHTPFRGSKLTLVLKDSFTGNCKTLMIGNISPCASSCEHTLNTLRYADRVKELKKPTTGLENNLNGIDLLAKQLMLPRQSKNAIKIPLNNQPVNAVNAKQLMRPSTAGGNAGSPSKVYYGQLDYNFEQNGLFDQAMQANQNGPSSNQNYQNLLVKKPTPMIQKANSNPAPNNSKLQKSNEKAPTSNVSKTKHVSSFSPSPKRNTVKSSIVLEQGFQHFSKDEITNWRAKDEEDLQVMSQKHEQLIGIILQEEEDVIGLHRQHIDDMVELTKQEMMILHEVDKPGSDVDEYVENLDVLLEHKLEVITMLRGKLLAFKDHLKEEELLSKKFYEQRNEIMDVFDLTGEENASKNGDMQLLESLPSHN